MRIVDLDAFIAMPAETLFAKYAPCHFGELMIKGDSLMSSRDFLYQDLADAIDCNAPGGFVDSCFRAEAGESVEFDFNCQGRDGCFEPGQLFAVWERADVQALVTRLQECLDATQHQQERSAVASGIRKEMGK